MTICYVNPHVLLGLCELSFVLCNPHFLFIPGLREEVFFVVVVHVDLQYRVPRLPHPAFFFMQVSSYQASIWAVGTSHEQ